MSAAQKKAGTPLTVEDIMRIDQNRQVKSTSKEPDCSEKNGSDSDEDNVQLLKDIFKNADVRGRRPGSRVWKQERNRLVISSVEKTKKQREIKYEERMRHKKEIKETRELSKSILEAKAEAKRLRKQRREENLKNKEKNAKKAEIVQVITNTAKLKKIKNKNQLRSIQKRDTTGMV